jgi:hypothetical protein
MRYPLMMLVILVLFAAALRLADLPGGHEVRDVDEMPYLQGSLQLLEGMTPMYKYSPAGPQTWLGWVYAGAKAGKYTLVPTAEEQRVPLQIRPFVAVNHALFDIYRDQSWLRLILVIISDVLSIIAVAAAFGVGFRVSDLAGGVLLGGMAAAAPMMVHYAGMSRPFSMAWSFAFISAYFGVCRTGRLALWGSAIAMGLSIGSRIDMLVLLPIIWGYLWMAASTRRGSFIVVLKHMGISAATTMLVAPWLLTNIIGNLRTIATVRFSPPSSGPIPWTTALREFAWQEAFGPVALVFVCGLFWGLVRRKLSRPVICLYVGLLSLSVLKSTGHGIGHQGAAVVPMLMAAPMALAVFSFDRRLQWALVSICLAMPTVFSVYAIAVHRRDFVPDEATAWVESHVPTGTIIYLSPSLHDPLPTAQRGRELWQEVMMNDAADKKFAAAMTRFHLSDVEIPRALSEENMLVERGLRRRWYILASRSWLRDPRFDIRLFDSSRVFDVVDPWPDFAKTGGVVIWRGFAPAEYAGTPVVKWTNGAAVGTYVYCSADIRGKMAVRP